MPVSNLAMRSSTSVTESEISLHANSRRVRTFRPRPILPPGERTGAAEPTSICSKTMLPRPLIQSSLAMAVIASLAPRTTIRVDPTDVGLRVTRMRLAFSSLCSETRQRRVSSPSPIIPTATARRSLPIAMTAKSVPSWILVPRAKGTYCAAPTVAGPKYVLKKSEYPFRRKAERDASSCPNAITIRNTRRRIPLSKLGNK
jgi:hypothetical protein